MRVEQVWDEVRGSLRDQIGAENYNIWIQPIRITAADDARVALWVPNRYFRDWVRENYGTRLTEEFRARLGTNVTIEFQIGTRNGDPAAPSPDARPASPEEFPDDEVADASATSPDPASTAGAPTHSIAAQPPAMGEIPGVATDKTFDNFVVGACNQFAHAAALAVAERPGDKQYNPLFIYGSTGLGKTHLMHAIGNAMHQANRDARVVYCTAERFTNQLIEALRYRRMPDFRDRYRKNTDILLVDDIQFLSGKERTQEELFHTFEHLREHGKQIVFTADVLPREIDGLEPRLRTRCESGMIADMQPPDMETMLAILNQKAEDMGMPLERDLAQWIATRLRGSIRELEGVLNRLDALRRMAGGRMPNIETARQHLVNILPQAPAPPTAEEIIGTVANFYGLKVSDLKGSRRLKQIVRPRHVAMYLVRTHTDLSFPDIGRAFGGKDHATVQHACKKIVRLLEKEPDLRNAVENIERMLLR